MATVNLSSIITPANIVTASGTETLTNKTINIASNTLTGVQPTLVSGTSIKTVNSTSLLGSGDIALSSGLTLLSTVTASGAATADIETTFSSTYDNYLIVVSRLRPGTAGDDLWLRMKLGGSYLSGTYDYTFTLNNTSAATYSGVRANGSAKIILGSGFKDTDESQLQITLSNPTGTTYKKPIQWQGVAAKQGSGSHDGIISGAGGSEAVSALTGIRIMFSTGTITGTFRLYGIANS